MCSKWSMRPRNSVLKISIPSCSSRWTERVNVLAALTSNKAGFVPRLVSGKPVKADNQLSNKQREHIQKQLAQGKEPRYTSHREDADHDEAQSARAAVSARRQPSDDRAARWRKASACWSWASIPSGKQEWNWGR